MGTATSKLQLILELDNKMKSGLSQARQQVIRSTNNMQGRLDRLRTCTISNLATIRNEVPQVGAAFTALANPITAVVAGVGAMAVGLSKASAESKRFSYAWRELQMLNIDKSAPVMNGLERMIKRTSLDNGFDHAKAATAFFDVQSTTGKFGGEVDAIVSKQGEFAQLMQVDFNNYIAGTAKAMANFGFDASKLDEFNRSAFATVKTGVTTFDELANVQSVYAGAATSAKQDFNAANKLFSIFTTKVKSADEAATLTKSLFNDLSKKSTMDAFNKVGIEMFDVNDQFKQADVLLLELQKRFREVGSSDQKLIDLKNQFTGSEGLIAFIQAATDQSEQLKQTIASFDEAKFSLPKALEIARNDENYITMKLENETKVILADIGRELVPLKNGLAKVASGLLLTVKEFFTSNESLEKNFKTDGQAKALELFPELANPTKLTAEAFDRLMGKVNQSRQVYYDNLNEHRQYKDPNWYSRQYDKQTRIGFELYHYNDGIYTALRDLSKQAREARAAMGGDYYNDFIGVKNESPNVDTSTSTVVDTKVSTDLQSVKRGGQTKNLTITIDSFIKDYAPTHQSINEMDKEQLEQWLTDMFMRVAQSAEQS
ncbi:MAG: phage tail tape measure protein [Bacteroidales bacterium]